MLSNTYINALFDSVVEATEEAILNALLAAETMTGRDGVTAYRLDPQRLVSVLKRS
jgi:D-aminopeptidase